MRVRFPKDVRAVLPHMPANTGDDRNAERASSCSENNEGVRKRLSGVTSHMLFTISSLR